MTLKLKNLTVRNFMSVGNATQAINFDRNDLTLVIGENLDLGGDDSGSRNGTGKTTIVNALCYAFFGTALTKIKKDNLINKINNKNMMVTVEFDMYGKEYKIERGRKPGVLRFIVDGKTDDEAQGENKETEIKIQQLLGLTTDMFNNIVTLNTYSTPFLNMSDGKQRLIIEQLLGITLLSEKAENLKIKVKKTKDQIQVEEFEIKSVIDANSKIKDQIKSLEFRQKAWQNKRQETVDQLVIDIASLTKIDIEAELENFTKLIEYEKIKDERTKLDLEFKPIEKNIEITERKIREEIQKLNLVREDNKCPTCEQDLHTNKDVLIENIQNTIGDLETEFKEYADGLELWRQQHVKLPKLGDKPTTLYNNERDAMEHQNTLSFLQSQLAEKENEEDPYTDQIADMTTEGIETISYELLNELVRYKDHQEFLLKLLTNKDSFIRKRIIDQNLFFLNQRLHHYLEQIGLPHKVKFMNDLSVEISEYGRNYDFDNLSRGESNRLIIALSLSFRDVWENLYCPINLLFLDELVDSGMDALGIDKAMAILKSVARERRKSVWLISHKDELVSRVNNVLTVTKENSFTSYGNDVTLI